MSEMRYFLLPFLVLAIGAGQTIDASRATADACAVKLDPAAKSIYAAAAPSMKPGADLRRVLTHVVMPMVMSGDMNRRTAEPRAEEASLCLQLMQ